MPRPIASADRPAAQPTRLGLSSRRFCTSRNKSYLAVDNPHHFRCVTFPLHRSARKRVLNPLEVLFVKLNIDGMYILFQAGDAACPGDRNDVSVPTQNP